MTSSSDIARRAGLTVLGEVGETEDARSVWRGFLTGGPVPFLRVPESENDLVELEDAWSGLADRYDLATASGEFLLSISSPENAQHAWMHVRASRPFDVTDLGSYPFSPSFVASDLQRSVAIGVLTDESGYLVFVSPRPTRPISS